MVVPAKDRANIRHWPADECNDLVVMESEVWPVNFMHLLLQNDVFSSFSMTNEIIVADLSLNSISVTFDFDPFKLNKLYFA